MVDIFIIHAGEDEGYIHNELVPYLNDNGEGAAKILIMSSKKDKTFKDKASDYFELWRVEVRQKIKKAQAVIVVLSPAAVNKDKFSTMGWEVRQARKLNKMILLHELTDTPVSSTEMPEYLKMEDKFTKVKSVPEPKMTKEEIKERIDNFDKGYYQIFTKKYAEAPQEVLSEHSAELLEQYKMFQKTSEDLVVRRQEVNSFYITVNSAMAAVLGLVLGLVHYPVNFLIIGFMSIVGIILDISWIGILESYGTLNSAKMKLINLIEEQLPVPLYDLEWRIMSDKLNSRKYVSFTDSEKRVPKLFLCVYVFVLAISAAVLLSLIKI